MSKQICVAVLLLLVVTAHAAGTKAQLQVRDAWIRATPPNAPTAAGYLTLVNAGPADRLVSISSEMADRVELHTNQLQGGVMRMRTIANLALEPASQTVLAPSGTHLMFIAPHKPFLAGQTVRATLHFQHAPPQQVDFKVMPLGTMSAPAGHDMAGMKM